MMTDINQIVEFFRFAVGKSKVIQKFHFGNRNDVNTENLNNFGEVKDYPLLICTPPTSQMNSLKERLIYSVQFYLFCPYRVLPDSTTDSLHNKEVYFAEMEKAVLDLLFYFRRSNLFCSDTQVNFEYFSEGDLIILKTSFECFAAPNCDITTIDNSTSYAGFTPTTVNPENLLSLYQK